MKKFIIGIAGKAGSGKDTVANMINYIIETGINDSSYTHWSLTNNTRQNKHNKRIIHFADPLKDCLSIIYSIPREYFDNRDYKENYYYSLDEHKFIKKEDLLTSHEVITIETLSYHSLNIYKSLYSNKKLVISLRDLMQYYGTEICRKKLGNNIWVDSTMKKADEIVEKYDICIIPDVRFKNEAKAINSSYLYGGIIKINRNVEQLSHESENIDFKRDYEIDNNKDKLQLFYNVLNIIKQLFKYENY